MLTNPSTLGLFDENIEADPRHLPRRRRAHVLRRREPERRLRDLAPRRHGLRHRPHQPAQDVLAAARRRRPRRRARSPCASSLADFLPRPVVVRDGDRFRLDYDRPRSIGKVRGFSGPFGVFVRSYAFMRAWGPGLREMSEIAVLNANYLLARLRDAYDLPYDRLCMHEFVLSARTLKQRARHHGARRREAADGLRLPPADGLLPARRPRGADDRADRDRGEGDARRVRRRDARDRPRGGGGARRDPAPRRTARPVGRLDEARAVKQLVVRHRFDAP